MNDRQSDEERIFHIARGIGDQETRSAYLDQICADDQALRERVEELLQTHESEQSFLKSNNDVAETADHSPVTETEGQQIGRYKRLQKIGEGGFGVVFMAEQQRPVKRKVALKIIKPGMDTREVVARFEAERQALALMDHTNIARVLDGGATDSGRPFFVMELVKGVPITEYCDKNQLSTEERLQLFTTVCQAVQHAHQKGIIHRDLKPSNVLVTLADGKPVTKVIDFGVAKATNQELTEKTLFTAFGQMVGTPQYMSPEQAEMSCLDVDTRSDIYSLGVLLYELLTGTTPLEAKRLRTAGYAEMQRMIREDEPPKPSTRLSTSGDQLTVLAKHRSMSPEKLKRKVRGDLDWIVMKALEKDRNRRYESPGEFQQDVVRFLQDEPVEARPPTMRYRAAKYLHRNGAALTVTAIMFTLLLAGTIGTTVQWLKAKSTLNQLQDELLNQAFELAFVGDLLETKKALSKARQADAPQPLCDTILGIAHLYNGNSDDAVQTLDNVVEEHPNNLGAVCAASWANLRASRYDKSGQQFRRIGRLTSERAISDHELLLLAQATVYGTSDIRGLINDLDALIQKHQRWGIAYANRARAKMQLVSETKSFELARSAASDAIKANRLLYNNPFVLEITLEVYAELILMARQLGKDTTEFERDANEIAKLVDDWDQDLQTRHRRLWYYRVVDHPDYQAERRALFKEGWAFPQPILAELIQEPDPKQLYEFAKQNDEYISCEIALAIRDAIDGKSKAALETYKKLQQKTEAFNTHLSFLDIPALAGRPDRLKEAAQEMLAQLPDHDPAHYWDFEVTCARYLAQEPTMSDYELLEKAGPFYAEQSTAHYFIGMLSLANGQTGKARIHLKKCADLCPPGWWYHVFSAAYLKLIDEGRIPTASEVGDPLESEEHADD